MKEQTTNKGDLPSNKKKLSIVSIIIVMVAVILLGGIVYVLDQTYSNNDESGVDSSINNPIQTTPDVEVEAHDENGVIEPCKLYSDEDC